MQKSKWLPVLRGDEYAERGDEAHVDTSKFAYYFNRERLVVRRYGFDGSYCEVNVLGKPVESGLSNLFSVAKSQGRLRAVEPGSLAA